MHRQVNAIAGRLSLRPPQRRSLEILDRVTEIVPPHKARDLNTALATIHSEFPTVTDFERGFPSLCFALATGVGKTRLMGAFISYLYVHHYIQHFFVLAPNLTIYNKLITDFTPNTAEVCVQRHWGVCPQSPPLIVTGDNYESGVGIRRGELVPPGFERDVHKSTCSISPKSMPKCAARGHRASSGCPSILARATSITWQSWTDLVVLMDESHRYRATAGVRAINELMPVLGLELTATPQVEPRCTTSSPFKNVIYSYPLAAAMNDGFVKEPAVATRENFDACQLLAGRAGAGQARDGGRIHENTKVELEVYARNNDTTHRQAVHAGGRPGHGTNVPCSPTTSSKVTPSSRVATAVKCSPPPFQHTW